MDNPESIYHELFWQWSCLRKRTSLDKTIGPGPTDFRRDGRGDGSDKAQTPSGTNVVFKDTMTLPGTKKTLERWCSDTGVRDRHATGNGEAARRRGQPVYQSPLTLHHKSEFVAYIKLSGFGITAPRG